MRILVIFLLFFLSIQSNAGSRGFHAYGAFGINYTPSSYRIGYSDWELGLLNSCYGFNKIFDSSNGYYTSFGLGLTSNGMGLFSAMGFKTDLLYIPMRLELSGFMDSTAASFASALIGFTYGF